MADYLVCGHAVGTEHGFATVGRKRGRLGTYPKFGRRFVTRSPSHVGDGTDKEYESRSRHLHLPKMEFPKFDGTNPRLWRDHCERYFEVYSVVPFLKTRFAALNFTESAAVWLQIEEVVGEFRTGMTW